MLCRWAEGAIRIYDRSLDNYLRAWTEIYKRVGLGMYVRMSPGFLDREANPPDDPSESFVCLRMSLIKACISAQTSGQSAKSTDTTDIPNLPWRGSPNTTGYSRTISSMSVHSTLKPTLPLTSLADSLLYKDQHLSSNPLHRLLPLPSRNGTRPLQGAQPPAAARPAGARLWSQGRVHGIRAHLCRVPHHQPGGVHAGHDHVCGGAVFVCDGVVGLSDGEYEGVCVSSGDGGGGVGVDVGAEGFLSAMRAGVVMAVSMSVSMGKVYGLISNDSSGLRGEVAADEQLANNC